jgi:tetratricopeptide (TPR) repeat protein
MFDSDSKLRHLAFFEEIATLEEEESDAWLTATAGLVTLRLVDAWLESGVGNASDDEWNFRSVCAAVEKVNERSPVRSLLTSVLMAIREGRPNVKAVVPSLMAFAKALEWDAKWNLAVDVYQTLLAHLHPVENGDASAAAHLRLGSCYRNLQRTDAAAVAYNAAMSIAMAAGDMDGVLRARIGEAALASLRGNLPEAATILDSALTSANGPGLRDARATALGERSAVAILSGQYELGIRLAYSALVEMQSSTDRDRVLNNIATAFSRLGVFSAARDAYLVLSATAQEQYMRWTATLNLLDVASMSGSEVLFESYRRQLAGAPLVPQLQANFEMMLGEGYRRFGKFDKARQHLDRAVALAQTHSLNQLLIEAEVALTREETSAPPRRSEVSSTLETQEVARALQEMRVAAGIT